MRIYSYGRHTHHSHDVDLAPERYMHRMLVSLPPYLHPSTYPERQTSPDFVILRLLLAPSLVKPGLAIFMLGPSEGPLFRCADLAGTIYSYISFSSLYFPPFPPSSPFIVIAFVLLFLFLPIICLPRPRPRPRIVYSRISFPASTTHQTFALASTRHRTACITSS
jgi:hypothetical protein